MPVGDYALTPEPVGVVTTARKRPLSRHSVPAIDTNSSALWVEGARSHKARIALDLVGHVWFESRAEQTHDLDADHQVPTRCTVDL